MELKEKIDSGSKVSQSLATWVLVLFAYFNLQSLQPGIKPPVAPRLNHLIIKQEQPGQNKQFKWNGMIGEKQQHETKPFVGFQGVFG